MKLKVELSLSLSLSPVPSLSSLSCGGCLLSETLAPSSSILEQTRDTPSMQRRVIDTWAAFCLSSPFSSFFFSAENHLSTSLGVATFARGTMESGGGSSEPRPHETGACCFCLSRRRERWSEKWAVVSLVEFVWFEKRLLLKMCRISNGTRPSLMGILFTIWFLLLAPRIRSNGFEYRRNALTLFPSSNCRILSFSHSVLVILPYSYFPLLPSDLPSHGKRNFPCATSK